MNKPKLSGLGDRVNQTVKTTTKKSYVLSEFEGEANAKRGAWYRAAKSEENPEPERETLDGKQPAVRINAFEVDILSRAANFQGMTLTHYLRSTAMIAARALVKEYDLKALPKKKAKKAK